MIAPRTEGFDVLTAWFHENINMSFAKRFRQNTRISGNGALVIVTFARQEEIKNDDIVKISSIKWEEVPFVPKKCLPMFLMDMATVEKTNEYIREGNINLVWIRYYSFVKKNDTNIYMTYTSSTFSAQSIHRFQDEQGNIVQTYTYPNLPLDEINGPVVEVKEDEGKQCKICLKNKANITFIPCGHLTCCPNCANDIIDKPDHNCPVCRREITDHVVTFY